VKDSESWEPQKSSTSDSSEEESELEREDQKLELSRWDDE